MTLTKKFPNNNAHDLAMFFTMFPHHLFKLADAFVDGGLHPLKVDTCVQCYYLAREWNDKTNSNAIIWKKNEMTKQIQTLLFGKRIK